MLLSFLYDADELVFSGPIIGNDAFPNRGNRMFDSVPVGGWFKERTWNVSIVGNSIRIVLLENRNRVRLIGKSARLVRARTGRQP